MARKGTKASSAEREAALREELRVERELTRALQERADSLNRDKLELSRAKLDLSGEVDELKASLAEREAYIKSALEGERAVAKAKIDAAESRVALLERALAASLEWQASVLELAKAEFDALGATPPTWLAAASMGIASAGVLAMWQAIRRKKDAKVEVEPHG